VRLRNGSIRGRVKPDVPIVFTAEKLTSYGELEIFRRFFDRSGFSDRLREAFSLRQIDGDYGSFRIPLAQILNASRIEYAIRAPLWDWLSIRPEIARRKRWKSSGQGIDAFSIKLFIPKWQLSIRVVIDRKKVSHATRKNFQMDFLDPNDGHYAYSVFAMNKKQGLKTVWDFRADVELMKRR